MKNKHIKVITQKDKATLQAFSNVHVLTNKHLKHDLGQNKTRIQGLRKDGYIQRKSFYNKGKGRTENFYTLTRKGRELAYQQNQTKYFYTSNSPKHDSVLASEYFKLEPEQRNSWITETEQRQSLSGVVGSPCDGGYVSETGEIVLIEVVTQNYTAEQRQEKQEYAINNNAEYREVRG